MATSPARICSCGQRVASGKRCKCVQARDRERPSARKRGYDTAFQKAAAAYLKAHPTCTCGKPAVLVRHKQSIRSRPDLRMEETNWLPGCRSCNAKDEARGGRRLSAEGGWTARGTSAGKFRNGLFFAVDADFDLEAGHGARP